MISNEQNSTPRAIALTIPSGTTDSNIINVSQRTIVGLIVPAALNGIARISFKVAPTNNGNTLLPLYDITNTIVDTPIAVSRQILLDPTDFSGVAYVQVVANANATANTEFKLVTRAVL